MADYKFFADLCMAVCVNCDALTETIVTGAPKKVFSYIKGEPAADNHVSVSKREMGSFLFDLSGEYKMQNYLKGTSIDVSDKNVVCNYIKTVIDKARAENLIDEDTIEMLSDHTEITQTRLINEDFIIYQRHLSFSPSREPNTDQALNELLKYYIKDDFPVMIVKGKKGEEYAVTDISIVSMVDYYIRLIYSKSLFPRYCLNCGRLFLAKSSLFDVLCSDACRKQRNSEKMSRYREKHNDEYEALYMKVYQRWYTRIRRAKEKGQLEGDKLTICNDVFSGFTSESYEKRNDVRNGDISPEAFSKWIDAFEIQMNMLWADIK